jgi:hypothetical protein
VTRQGCFFGIFDVPEAALDVPEALVPTAQSPDRTEMQFRKNTKKNRRCGGGRVG